VFTGEPGNEYRETLASASEAAAAGGVTTMIVMPNTQPVIVARYEARTEQRLHEIRTIMETWVREQGITL